MNTLQVGIRLHDMKKTNLIDRFRLAKEQGFSCIHLASKLIYSEFNISSDGLTPGLASYIKKALNKYDLDIAVYGCYLNLANPNKLQLDNIISEYKANIRFASYLGCNVVGTETGAPNEEYQFTPECHTETALSYFLQNLKTIVNYAQSYRITIAIEPVWKHIVYNPQITRFVLKSINADNLKIIFDPVNMLSIENYTYQENLFKEMIALNGNDIIVLHCKDFFIDKNNIIAIAPGVSKNLDYKYILNWQKKYKPYLQATIENSTPENAVNARLYLESF